MDRKSGLPTVLIKMKMATAARRPPVVNNFPFFICRTSFLVPAAIDGPDAGQKPQDSKGEKINDVPEIEDPLDYGVEVLEETEGSEHLNHRRGKPWAEEVQDDGKPEKQKNETPRDRDNESNDLAAGQCGKERADGEICPGHQKTP